MALSIVYPPKDANASSAVDIVAVHGLGDSIETWTHPKSKAFWLKDFLPQRNPDARVMTFGYNAAAAFGQSTSGVIDHAKSLLSSLVDKREESEEKDRPLIFIAHSLGGILVKQALLQARLESRYQSILDATLGFIFLGTPHRGSKKATYDKVVANIARTVTHRPSPRLVTALQTNSDVLLRWTTDFRFQLPNYYVYSFYELRPMKFLSNLIVEKHSALLGVDHEEQIPVDANHSAMCKFETDSDDTFEKVYKRVRWMRDNPPRKANEQSGLYNKHFEIPYPVSPVFIGHDEVLQCLTTSFTSWWPSNYRHQRRFVLFGLGGTGKTQICLKYAQVHRERYWGIFWVDASTNDRIRQCFAQIARILQVDENLNSVKRKLANTPQAWLLVFDNADDPNLSLTPYLPEGDRGDIIITSRNYGCQQYNTVGSKEVGVMSLHNSVSLLTKIIYGETSPSHQAVEEGRKIVEALGCLPLAIVLAGAYIRHTGCSLNEYWELSQRHQMKTFHTGTDYRHMLYTTWQVSVETIESRQDMASSHALRLLKLLCFYHHDQIPVQMFYNAWHQSQKSQDVPGYLPWHDAVSDFFEYRQSVQESVSLLASFSLIARNTDLSLSIHPLVHAWCRERMSKDEQQLSYRRALSLLTGSVEWKFEAKHYAFRRSLVAHVHACLRQHGSQDDLSEEDKMREWPILALILGENGWTGDALQLTEQVVKLHKSKLGEDHPETLRLMHNLANRYSEAGRLSEALQLTKQVVELYINKLGEDHPDTLRSMHSLANRYSEAGRRSKALQLTEQVVELCKSKLGEDHPDTLTSMHNLAIHYSEAGRRSEALQLAEQVVKLRKSKLGEDHPETLRSMHNLANRYSDVGRRLEALQLTEQVVELQMSKLGEDHPETLRSMHSLAIRYSEAGRRSEALQLTEQVAELHKSKLGGDHPETLRSMHNLAVRYSEGGRQSEALQLMEQVVKLRKSKLGEDHPDTLGSVHNLAIHYREAGRRSETLQKMNQAVKLRKSMLGEDHPETLRSMHDLDIRYSEAGRRSEALQLREQIVKLRKSKLGEDHPEHIDDRPTFVDSAYGTASYDQFSGIKLVSPAETDFIPQDVDDASTEYSDISTAESKIYTYMECLADDLFAVAFTPQLDPQRSRTLCKALPDLLQEFALRIGQEAPSKEGREVMVYVYRHRRRVAELFEQHFINGNEGQEDSASTHSKTIPFQEKVTNWLTQENADAGLLEGTIHDFPDEQDHWTPANIELGSVEKYRGFVAKTSAYSWLLVNMGRDLAQAFQEDDLLKTIHDEIWRRLPALPKISIRRPPDVESLIFRVVWNPTAFILEQRYSEDPNIAFERAITLTGSPTDAQALSCLQYLNQTWPSSGKYVACLLQKLMRAENGQQVRGHLPDGSILTTWSGPSSVCVKVSGSRGSITEVGEQLAWLGAALRSSPYDGIAYCRPYIDDSQWTVEEQLDFKYSLEQVGIKLLRINFSFDRERLDADEHVEGRCWYQLFKNPVLVRGFPILRRSSNHNGLELPLNMMAGLVGALRAHVFNHVVFIKGFSTMLVPTKQADDLIVWHVFFSADGSRISYLKNNLPQLRGVGIQCLQTSRHIVGWCSRAKSHAGGLEANYNIDRSRLPLAGADCVLEKVSISGGKFVTAGFNFGIGIKDVPIHISRKPYMQKLRWVSSKFIVLWDEEEKRGWLVNGINALLHLVRASLKHYETDAFKEALLSKSDDILEPSAESEEDYAISILRNEHNMKLPIYAEKDEVQPDEDDSITQDFPHAPKRKKRYYRLEDRVEELYEILEKLIDHQINVTGQAGVKMKAHVRRRLEGWDFKDLASDKDPISPHVATLHALGKGWVDFIRSIQAVTLFGKGFGQIIKSSSNIACPHWSEVPKDKFYLAACLSDLRQIIETDGDCTANPMKICNGISWYTPNAAFGACRCAKTHGGGHSDFAQILWPTSLQSLLPKRESIPLQEEGAVIFGHNIAFKWKWEDTGDPVEADPGLESSITEDDFHDSGLGLTETSGSGQADRGPPDNGSSEMTSPQPSQTSGTNGAAPEISRAGPVSLQYTTGSNAVDRVHTAGYAARSPVRSSKAGNIIKRLFRGRFGK